jgi:SAM-dependent methyltransferase
MYTDVATNPAKEFHFPTGRAACEFVGYPQAQLDSIPATAVESFAGVGYPFRSEVMFQGAHVLDIGSGSGTDVLISASLVGRDGHVHALDMTPAMLEKLKANIAVSAATNISLHEGNAESIPLLDESVDIVTSNGVLNLVPDKKKAFDEMFRVLKPRGRVQIADIVVGLPISDECRGNPKLWAECIVGASLEDDYVDLFRIAGFESVTKLRTFDYFSGSSSEATKKIALSFGAGTIELTMTKP